MTYNNRIKLEAVTKEKKPIFVISVVWIEIDSRELVEECCSRFFK